MKKWMPLTLILLFTSLCSYAEVTKIVVWKTNIPGSGIIGDTLEKALDITQKEYGEYQLIASDEMVQNRALRELSNENIQLDVGSFVSTAEREKQAIVIRIPIMNGLLGYRICLIKEGNQEKFTGITNKKQWLEKDLSIGQHISWPDTTILENSGFNVKTTFKRELLFQQLSKNRFDCFARGASEISNNLVSHGWLGLDIEDNIVIHYPFPLFFYVSRQNPLLAERLQLGLTRLHKSAVTDQLVEKYYGEQLRKLSMQKRHFIELNNPMLSQQTIEALKKFNIK